MELRIKKERLTSRELDVIIELADNEGYTQKELINKTGIIKTNLSAYLKNLEQNEIVYRKIEINKKKSRGNSGSDMYYYIGPKDIASSSEKLNIFHIILNSSLVEIESDLQKKLLASEYVNSLIATCGLKPVYEIMEEYMEREEFRRIASQALLSQPALIDEYIKLPALMMEYMESNRGVDLLKYMDETKYLRFLFGLNFIDSIRFYKKYLADPFGKLYRDLTDRDVPRTEDAFVTDGIRKFLELDLFLSPLTSFPMNYPVELLFERPFERLYTDFYIFDKEDIKKLIHRAYIVYSNFVDIVSAGVANSGSLVTDLEALLKLYIFYWNVASQSLDSLCGELKKLNKSTRSIYHIYSEITGLQIMDLADKSLLLDRVTKSVMNYNSLMICSDDPTKEIRICDCFEEMGLKTEKIIYDDVLQGIRSKLENETTEVGNGLLAYGSSFLLVDNKIVVTLPGGQKFEVIPRDPSHHYSEREEETRKSRILIETLLDEQERQKHHKS